MNQDKLVLPTLRGKMGDWVYYVTLLPFKQVASRISLADEIHKDKGLSHMIQREVSDRTKDIVSYLESQEQRFFNSLILGIYGGAPQWQEISIEKNHNLNEEEVENFNKTFGILMLNGDEKIFAIDGQHRSKAIQEAIKSKLYILTRKLSTFQSKSIPLVVTMDEDFSFFKHDKYVYETGNHHSVLPSGKKPA